KRSLLYRLMPACFVVAGMVAIWRLCRRTRYDVIHVHWPLPLALFGWAAQRARPARLVTTFYGVELRWVKGALPFFKGFLAWAARRSDRVIAISQYTAGELRALADVPIEVIPYTTSLPEPAARPPEARDGTGPVLVVDRRARLGVRPAMGARNSWGHGRTRRRAAGSDEPRDAGDREPDRRHSGHRGGRRVGAAGSAGRRGCAGGGGAAGAWGPRPGAAVGGSRAATGRRAVQGGGDRAGLAV